jgi:hypothetical protein
VRQKNRIISRYTSLVLSVHMLSVCAPVFAQASQENSLIENKRFKQFETVESPTSENLPPVLLQVARFTGALPIMQVIEALQRDLKQSNLAVSDPIVYLAKRQKLIYLREKLNNILETSNLEVNAARGQIEGLMSELQTQQAKMVEKRARTLRRNTIINFVSGGITKLVGYSIALGGNDTTSNILEIFDGGVQCGLSGTVIKDLHSESRVVGKMPVMLTQLDRADDPDGIYPRQVWNYLNESSSGNAGLARREELTKNWESRGFYEHHTKFKNLKENSNLQGHLALARITPQLLDDRQAMLSELRSTVSEMHASLMELSLRIKQSYNDDPSFDWPIAIQ